MLVHVCEDGLEIYHALLLQRSRPLVCPSKVPSLTDEVLQCANKEVESALKERVSGLDERRGKYNDYTPEER